jgi:hypothetical protein
VFPRKIRDCLSQFHLKLTRRKRTGGGTERLMYTDPRNSWVREVAGGIPSLCSVLSWASFVHYTAYYCVMYCFIKHHRMKTCGDWKNSSTYAHSRQKVEVTPSSVGRSVIQAFSQASTHWLRSWVGLVTCRLSVNINRIVSEVDEMARAVKLISVTNLVLAFNPSW